MKKTLSLAALALTMATGAFADHEGTKAHAELINIDGEKIGMAHVTQGPNGVLIHLKASGLTPGKHGVHLHYFGSCDPATGFKSAKGHIGSGDTEHGFMNPKGTHAGDIPNLFVGADGTGEMEAFSTKLTVGGKTFNLLDDDGSAFIIHEGPDDHISQPIGGSGGRVACGVIKASK